MAKSKIIIDINNYETPNHLASYGVSLAKRLKREAVLTSVLKTPVPTGAIGVTGMGVVQLDAANMEQVKKQRETDLKKVYEEAKWIWDQVDYEIEVGFPVDALIKKSKEELPFLFIIEGNNELTTLGEWFGTYETRLAKDIDVPVLIVPTEQPWKPVNNILYTMELDDSKAKNIRLLYEISKELSANLHIMLIAEDNSVESYKKYNHILNTLRNFYDYRQVHYHFVYNIQSVDEIIRMTKNIMIDWLAFEHAKSSFIERVFSNYNTERLILKSEIPVLVF